MEEVLWFLSSLCQGLIEYLTLNIVKVRLIIFSHLCITGAAF